MSEPDAYALLGLERRLTLDADELNQAFKDVGKKHHPDAGGSTDAFEAIQRAKQTLSKPETRLRHWLELQGIEGDWRGSVSNDLMSLFMELGNLLQTTDDLLRERDKASSALVKAMLEGKVHEAREQLEAMQEKIESSIDSRTQRFDLIEKGEIDGWEVARDMAFLDKWRSQVRERYARLW